MSRHKLTRGDARAHERKLAQKWTRIETHAFYTSSDWQRIRARQLAREPMCRSCGKPASEVDHVLAIARGGAKRDPTNLQSLCESCHSQKTKREMHGLHWTPIKHRGCNEHGQPNDPAHPWNRAQEPQ